MFQNPNKYDKILLEEMDKICRESPVLQSKIDDLESIKNKYLELCKEEKELLEEKSTEFELHQSGDEKCQLAKQDCSNSEDLYNNIVQKLKDVIFQEAKLAIKNGNNPYICLFSNFEGPTPFVQNTRIHSSLISLKAKIMEKEDELNRLQKLVYCYDESSDDINNEDGFTNSFQFEPNNKTYEYLLNNFRSQTSHQNRSVATDTITNLTKSISGQVKQADPNPSIPFELFSFTPQSDTEIDGDQFDLLLEKAAQSIQKVCDSNIQTKEKIEYLFKEIEGLYHQRQEILTRVYSSVLSNSSSPEIASNLNTLISSSEAIRKSQSIVDLLNVMVQKNAIPSSVWNCEREIHQKMAKLLDSINNITSILSSTLKHDKLDKLGYSLNQEAVEITEVSSYQLQQCQELISDLQKSLSELEKERIFAMSSISESIETMVKIKQEKQSNIEKETNENAIDKLSANGSLADVGFAEDAQLLEIMQARESILEKQNEELRKLMELVQTIPDELKDIDFNKEDVEFQAKPLPVIQLPPVLNDDELFSNDQFNIDESEMYVDEINERNTRNIEIIKAKKVTTASNGGSTADENINNEQKIKIIRNENLEKMLSENQPKPKSIYDPNRVSVLVEKKTMLSNYVNEVTAKMDTIKGIKSEIDKMEKTIKKFPIYRDRNTKQLENNNKTISELNEKINSIKNSPEYIKYNELCEKIKSLQKDIDEF